MIVTAQAPVRIDFGGAWTDVDLYARDHGGVVFNATLTHYVSGTRDVYESGEGARSREGLEVRYGFDLPTGSGLGTSASLNVCWFALIGQGVGGLTDDDRRRIAEQAYGLEELLAVGVKNAGRKGQLGDLSREGPTELLAAERALDLALNGRGDV